MSPGQETPKPDRRSVPRASGDEPRMVGVAAYSLTVFPARAGMSPTCSPIADIEICVPRASGDEPLYLEPSASS